MIKEIIYVILSKLVRVNKNKNREGICLAKKRNNLIIKTDIKQRHPEEQIGEILLCNLKSLSSFNILGWNTKRIGKVAYQKDNITPMENPDMFPVFINRQEPQEKKEKYIVDKEASPGWLKKLLEI